MPQMPDPYAVAGLCSIADIMAYQKAYQEWVHTPEAFITILEAHMQATDLSRVGY